VSIRSDTSAIPPQSTPEPARLERLDGSVRIEQICEPSPQYRSNEDGQAVLEQAQLPHGRPPRALCTACTMHSERP